MIYFVILFFLLKYIIDKIFEENVIFNYFKHINVSDSDDDLMNVYIIKDDDYIKSKQKLVNSASDRKNELNNDIKRYQDELAVKDRATNVKTKNIKQDLKIKRLY